MSPINASSAREIVSLTRCAGFYDTRSNAERAKRNHIRQLEALGYKVTLQPAA